MHKARLFVMNPMLPISAARLYTCQAPLVALLQWSAAAIQLEILGIVEDLMPLGKGFDIHGAYFR